VREGPTPHGGRRKRGRCQYQTMAVTIQGGRPDCRCEGGVGLNLPGWVGFDGDWRVPIAGLIGGILCLALSSGLHALGRTEQARPLRSLLEIASSIRSEFNTGTGEAQFTRIRRCWRPAELRSSSRAWQWPRRPSAAIARWLAQKRCGEKRSAPGLTRSR
jgi:hypothetical protein